jgi:hypothetical protein
MIFSLSFLKGCVKPAAEKGSKFEADPQEAHITEMGKRSYEIGIDRKH